MEQKQIFYGLGAISYAACIGVCIYSVIAFPISSPEREQALRYSHCQDCALLLYSDVFPQNYSE